MKTPTLLIVLLISVAPAWPVAAQFEDWNGRSIIQDPEWRARFLGSYGFLSGVEPEIHPQELTLLREVIDLMQVNPRAAASRLASDSSADSSAALDFVLANLEFQNGNVEAASTHYAAAIAKFPDFRRAHKNMGLLLVQKGDCEKALVHLSRAVELGDRDGRNFGLMGFCHVQTDRHLAASEAYRNAILQQPDVRDWKLGLARALLAMERHREAVALFEQLIAEDQNDTKSWMLQANAYLGLDEPEAAAVNLEAVRMLGVADTATLALLGDIYMNEGLHDLAQDAYLEVIEKDKGATQYRVAFRAADLLVRSHAYSEADEIVASIDRRYGKKLDRDEELDFLTLKAKLARAQGRDTTAAKLLESIVNRDGTRGDALLELAAYHQGRGDREKALLLIERAERLDGYEYRALLQHAQLQVDGRDYDRAAELLRSAIEIKSEPRVVRFLARVEQAR